MPTTVVKTIGAAQDYTTIGAWEAATRGNLVTADEVRVGQINTSANFNESITFAGCTTDATRYRKLTVADAHWHAGTYGASKARMFGKAPTGGRHLYVETDDYTVIERLQFSHVGASPGASDEAIRINVEAHHTVVSRCIFRGDRDPTTGNATSDTDAIYVNHSANGQTCTVHVDNCLFYDWGRAGVNVQFFNNAHDGGTVRVNVDHCSFDNCGNTSSEPEASGIHARNATGTTTTDMYVYNCVGGSFTNVSAGAGKFLLETDSVGRANWFGSHNADADGSVLDASINLTTGAQSSKVRENFFVGPNSDNYRPAAGQALENNGINRIGSEPDPRQNFALDIAGATRGTTGVEIGAYTIAAAGTTGTLVAQESGSDTASITGTLAAVTGTLSAQEAGVDTSSITGTLAAVTGTLAAQEAGVDVAAFTGQVVIGAALAAQEAGADVASISGSLAAITGTLATQESGQDVAAITGNLAAVTGSLAAQEAGADTAAFTGTVGSAVSGTLAAQEAGSDVAAITGSLAALTGSLAAQESGQDVSAITGSLAAVTGPLAAQESGSDIATLTGTLAAITGTVAAQEAGSDVAAFSGTVGDVIFAAFVAQEAGADQAAISGTLAALTGTLAAQESGADILAIAGSLTRLWVKVTPGADIWSEQSQPSSVWTSTSPPRPW